MNSRLRLTLAVAVVAFAGARARSQPVLANTLRISSLSSPESPDLNTEPAIIANGSEVLIGWQHKPPNPARQQAYYVVSLNGLATLAASPAALEVPPGFGCTINAYADMMAARSATGDLYLACQAFHSAFEDVTSGIVIGRKVAGLATALTNIVQVIPCSAADKGFLAIGPKPPSGALTATFPERA